MCSNKVLFISTSSRPHIATYALEYSILLITDIWDWLYLKSSQALLFITNTMIKHSPVPYLFMGMISTLQRIAIRNKWDHVSNESKCVEWVASAFPSVMPICQPITMTDSLSDAETGIYSRFVPDKMLHSLGAPSTCKVVWFIWDRGHRLLC